jgi:hypothetical protein
MYGFCVGSLAVTGPCLSAFALVGWEPTTSGLRVDLLFGCPLLLETHVIGWLFSIRLLQQPVCHLLSSAHGVTDVSLTVRLEFWELCHTD